jgi:hypothetical protein
LPRSWCAKAIYRPLCQSSHFTSAAASAAYIYPPYNFCKHNVSTVQQIEA